MSFAKKGAEWREARPKCRPAEVARRYPPRAPVARKIPPLPSPPPRPARIRRTQGGAAQAAHGPAKPTTIDEEEGRRGQGSAMVTTKPRAVAWAKAVLRWLAEGGAQVRQRVWFWRCFAEQLCKNRAASTSFRLSLFAAHL